MMQKTEQSQFRLSDHVIDPFHMPPVQLVWTSGLLLMMNPPQFVLSYLTYTEKQMVEKKGDNGRSLGLVTQRTQIKLYEVLDDGWTVTQQGFAIPIMQLLDKHKAKYELKDCRTPMPDPRAELAHNFRHSQAQLFYRALAHHTSGCISAPTRFGKTGLLANMAVVFPTCRTVITAPGVDLVRQLAKDIRFWVGEKREIAEIYTGSRKKTLSDDITVISMDSLDRIPDPQNVELLLVDEPHAAVTNTRWDKFTKFVNARKYAFGATLGGRFDNRDKRIIGLFGPVLACRTFKEAVDEGAICMIKVFMIKVPYTPQNWFTRNQAYDAVLFNNEKMAILIRRICRELIPAEWQTLVFIDRKTQGETVQSIVQDDDDPRNQVMLAIAGDMKPKEREQKFAHMVQNNVKRCVSTDIFAQGVTFPDLRVIINACGGGGAITSVQKPGRLAQVRPGKKYGYMIDFMFEPTTPNIRLQKQCWQQLHRDSLARLKSYQNTGYEIHVVNRARDIVFE